MSTAEQQAQPDASSRAPGFLATILRVAWLSIGLGLVLEVTVLIIAAGFGDFGQVVGEFLKKTSWWFLVCIGLAIGQTVASPARRMAVMGLMGLLTAPVAIAIARFLHHGMRRAIFGLEAAAGTFGGFPFLLAVLRGAEFGLLGVVIGWVGQQRWGGAVAYALTGFTTGIFFGCAVLGLRSLAGGAPLSMAGILSWFVNEIIFPTGCALILFSAVKLGDQVGR
jgi:hypothetical protein